MSGDHSRCWVASASRPASPVLLRGGACHAPGPAELRRVAAIRRGDASGRQQPACRFAEAGLTRTLPARRSGARRDTSVTGCVGGAGPGDPDSTSAGRRRLVSMVGRRGTYSTRLRPQRDDRHTRGYFGRSAAPIGHEGRADVRPAGPHRPRSVSAYRSVAMAGRIAPYSACVRRRFRRRAASHAATTTPRSRDHGFRAASDAS